jgi:hypothetical protein
MGTKKFQITDSAEQARIFAAAAAASEAAKAASDAQRADEQVNRPAVSSGGVGGGWVKS